MASLAVALEQTEIPPELFVPFRGLRNTPLFFSDYCRKLTTHKGVTITRVIVCTSEHLYLCHPNGDILRCFPYTAIAKVFHDEQRHQVGLVVPCEFDVAVETPLSFQLLHVIDVLRRMHGSRQQLEQVRVSPVPRPEGLLGFRPDGRAIWDQTLKQARKRKRHDQTCTEKCMDYCGLEESWIGVKDMSYRQYRRAMRYLDLGIEDDDEVLTSTAAMAADANAVSPTNANSGAAVSGAGSGGAGSPSGNAMLLAVGKTSFALQKQDAASMTNFSQSGRSNASTGSGTAGGAASDGEENIEDDAPAGYRWFRPVKGNKVRQMQDEEAEALASDNEVLNMLLSPMLGADEDPWEPGTMGASSPTRGAAGAAAAAEEADKKQRYSHRNDWWPGSQIGSSDGPYALALAKPKGFKVALDQRNSEFA